MGQTRDGRDAPAEEKDSCGQHSFSHWVLMKMHMNRDIEMDASRRTNYIPPHLTHRPTRQITASTFDKPCSAIQLSSSRSPTFTGRQAHLEDVATPTRQRWETLGDRDTGPQLRARNSKPWRISLTSSKARNLKPLIVYFCLNQSG